MDISVPTLADMAAGIDRGVAVAIREAHSRGLPVFVADESTIYAIYPDGRRVAVERVRDSKPE